MGNSPVDKGKDFIQSGKTLITDISSDKYLIDVKDPVKVEQENIKKYNNK